MQKTSDDQELSWGLILGTPIALSALAALTFGALNLYFDAKHATYEGANRNTTTATENSSSAAYYSRPNTENLTQSNPTIAPKKKEIPSTQLDSLATNTGTEKLTSAQISAIEAPGIQIMSGYDRKDGKHVDPYIRTFPNGIKSDNWSQKRNANPFNGKIGSHR